GIADGVVTYYASGWKEFGTTGTDGSSSKELLPGSYSFMMKYAGFSQQISNVNITETNPLVYTTVPMVVQFNDSNGNGIADGGVTYYASGWKEFGTTGADGSSTKELLPGSYSFMMNYAGFSQQISNVNIAETNPLVYTTVPMVVQFNDSAGNGIADGGVTYYASGWKEFGTTGADGSVLKELLPGSYSFMMKYAGFSQQISDVNITETNPLVYTTVPMVVKLNDSNGGGIADGVVTYYASGWKEFGTTGTDGSSSKELLPGSYSFMMKYSGFSQQISNVNIAETNPLVYTTLSMVVRLENASGVGLPGGTIKYYASGWKDYETSGADGTATKELLPGAYSFRITYSGITQNYSNVDITVTNPLVATFVSDMEPAIVLSPTTAKIKVGETLQFAATVYNEFGEIVDTAVTWTTTGNIGSINESGLFSPSTAGTGTVTASAAGMSKSADVTVTVDPVLTLTPTTVNLMAGDTQQFTATAFDENNDPVAVVWTTSGGIGTIDSNGLFSAVAAGSGLVIATAGNLTEQATVNVTVDPVLTLSPLEASVGVNGNIQFSAEAFDENGDPVEVAWSTEGDIGTVDSNGLFTAVSPGTVTVTATAGNLTQEAVVTVTVEPIIVLTPMESNIGINDTVQFEATVYDELGNVVEAAIVWNTGGGIGGIDTNGLFTATAPGIGTVTATAGNLSAVANVTVTIDPVLVLAPQDSSVILGDTIQYTATVYNEFGEVADETVEWSTSGDIGTINANGLFTGTTVGTGTVTASAADLTQTVNVEVIVDPISKTIPTFITITPEEADIAVGESMIFSVNALNSDGEVLPSSALNDAVVSVTGDIGEITNDSINNPEFTATNPGSGAIVVTLGGITAEAAINVTVDPVLTLTPTTVSVLAGDTQQFSATATDEYGDPVAVTWAVTGNIGTINTNGFFTAGTSAGTGTVTASAVGLIEIANVTITVDPVLTLTPTTVSLHSGLTQQFTATATDENGNPATVTWGVTENIGTVNSNGLFTAGVSAGTGTVTASAEGLIRIANVSVTVDPVLTLTPTTVSLLSGKTQQFSATATDENGNSAIVIWATSGNIGTIDANGLFTAGASPGNGTVTASSVGLTEIANITVTVDPVLTLSPTTVSLQAGLTQQFSAVATDENGDPAEITWAVTGDIGTVDSNGFFTAGLSAGSGTVTASAEGLTETANVTVTVDPVLNLSPETVSLRTGLTQQFNATAFDENSDPAEITWAVTGDIGSVDSNGMFTAGSSARTGTVTASAVGLSKSSEVTVTVDPVLVLTPTTVSIHADDTQQFSATATDENGNPALVEWAASEGIGNVNSNGLFTAGSSAGTGTVTASAVGLTRTANITVTVDPVLVLTPTTLSIHADDTQQFSATATDENGNPTIVIWATSGDIGTIDANGLFTAGENAGDGTVTASSEGLSEIAEITVTVDPELTLTPKIVSLQAEQTQQFSAVASDENGDPATVTWTVTGDIGSVDSSGLFTAGSSAGSGTLTASAVGLTEIADITVTVDPVLNLSPDTVSIHANDTQQFTATATDENGNPATITWATSGDIGTVNSNGFFTAGSSAGFGTLTASAVGLTKIANITVTVDPVLTLTPTTVSIHADDTQQFTATATDENGNPATVEWAASGGIGNISSSGLFTAGSSAGIGSVTASAVGLSETADVTVTVDPVLTLTPVTLSIHAGITQQFTATATDENGNPATVEWETVETIGSIDENGLFTAGSSAGTGTVTASAVGLTETADVTVTVDPVLTLTPATVYIMAGATQQFTATAFDENNNPVDVEWATSGDIGTLDENGLFTAQAAGSGVVTVSAVGLIRIANITVTVEPVLTLTPEIVTLMSGDIQQFTAVGFDENNEPVTPIWSTVGNIGTIDEDGLFTAENPGIGTVTATAGELSVEAEVTVNIEQLIVISPDTTEVMLEDTLQFSAVYYNEFGVIADEDIVWSTSGDVGAIDENGLFTASASGEGAVSASVGDITAEAAITVIIEPYIVLTPEQESVWILDTVQFTATVFDKYDVETEADIIWEIDGDFGTINENGLFTATAPGEGTVIATADMLVAEATVNVFVEAVLEITPEEETVVIGRKIHFKAELYDSTGTADQSAVITWSVEGGIGEIVDNLDKNIQFTATANGTGFVVATSGELTVKAAVTVVPEPGIVVTPLESVVRIGDTIQYTAIALNDLGDTLDVAIEWEVDEEIGEIDINGLFVASGAGVGVVTATADTLVGMADVTVEIEPYILISPDVIVAAIGDTVQYTAVAYDELENVIDGAIFEWSATGGIGGIDSEGLFVVTAPGEGTITAVYDSLIAEVSMTVNIEPYIEILSDTTNVRLGDSIQFTANVFNESGDTLDVAVEWSTTGDIGEIDQEGLFTSSAAGVGFVVATTDTDSLTAEVAVTVNIDSYLEIIPDSTIVSLGDSLLFSATAFDIRGDTLDVDLVWEVDGDIGEIDADGLFISSATGEGLITATGISAESETLVAQASVSVTIEPYITISPDTVAVNLNSQIIFTATVINEFADTLDVAVEWATEGGIGAIDSLGIFTSTAAGLGTVSATYIIAETDTLVAEAVVSVAENLMFSMLAEEEDKLAIFGIPYPLDFLNGMKLFFPLESIEDNIKIHFSLPGFANIDKELQQVLYFGDILTAVSFKVSVNDVFISPYTFGVPIEVSIPFDINRLNTLGLTPYDLTMMFVTSEGELESDGIEDITVDMEFNLIKGKVAHFSDLAIVPKSISSGVAEEDRPVGYALDQNYPNPFNPVTTITYALPVTSHVSITLYSILGQTVKTLVEEEKIPGYYNVIWDGRDENGGIVSSGLYIYQIQAGNFRQSKKLMFMK
ncbi:Ig-like domain-containing protein, partial [Candidatus Latescibacterota bacterium]